MIGFRGRIRRGPQVRCGLTTAATLQSIETRHGTQVIAARDALRGKTSTGAVPVLSYFYGTTVELVARM